ncbi:MrcB family domain-containing protein [Mycolicibacterium sediminis]|uniref:Type IV methyl-directed restriction enzyme EcoKMcrB subunit DNA-binding domain-containing protein n=1 Tax=Mycolicibacterium sediminis TaxID=1286180 RepID=A0A7I7QP04_9MYCO|nr:DUF3578 domain-containing protein [Mycolicibacterium sediminis]BBY28129.1 hypothetical protein MSEDJ_22250 [Mycolicibacterium sediminis]
MTVIDDIKTVLASTAYYLPTSSPEMAERAAAVRSMATKVRAWLPPELQIGDELATLKVDAGGQKGGISPTPWVRVFAERYSPSATQGFYRVYLFAGDGSRVYLSLNQGTSEFRSGHLRLMSSTATLLQRSEAARQFFAGWSGDLVHGLRTDIDLAVSSLDVGVQPKKRASNYEAAKRLRARLRRGHTHHRRSVEV